MASRISRYRCGILTVKTHLIRPWSSLSLNSPIARPRKRIWCRINFRVFLLGENRFHLSSSPINISSRLGVNQHWKRTSLAQYTCTTFSQRDGHRPLLSATLASTQAAVKWETLFTRSGGRMESKIWATLRFWMLDRTYGNFKKVMLVLSKLFLNGKKFRSAMIAAKVLRKSQALAVLAWSVLAAQRQISKRFWSLGATYKARIRFSNLIRSS